LIACAALVLAATIPAQAALFDYILGGVHADPRIPEGKFPTAPPRPDWDAALVQGNPDAGRKLFTTGQTERTSVRVMVCQSCHGENGIPHAGAAMPRLAGVTADYLAKQLYDFRTGRRDNEVMRQIARAMSPADIGSVTLYLASLPPAPFETTTASGNDVGRRIQELGDNARAIPACGNCHGPQGQAPDRLLPPLAGVDASYLRTQLRAWRAGTRRNDENAVMRTYAHSLTDAEISSLAAYYASVR
jgi:cytochrome c553